MSVTVIIKEGGLGKSLTVDKLKTNVSGGGTQLWIPEKNMTTKTITENGTYEAKDDDVPGWNKVIVNVAGGEGGSITGRDPDTGEDVNVSVDPETGDIVETVVPSSIRVTTPPTKTSYTDGQTIDYSGIVVHAYSATGQDMGEVPFNELVFPVTTASSESGQSSATSDLDTGAFTQPIPLSGAATFAWTQANVPVRNTNTWTPVNGAAIVIMRNTERSTKILYAATQAGRVGLWRQVSIDQGTEEQSTQFSYITASTSYTYGGKTVYYTQWSHTHAVSGPDKLVDPVVSDYGDDNHDKEAAWTAIYGTITGEDQSLPVQWPRNGDGKILETSFNIEVVSA